MWRYAREVMIEHWGGEGTEHHTWETVTAVTPSAHQGWDFHLADGCKLQSCFPDTEIEVRMMPNPIVDEWGKAPKVIRTEYDAAGQPVGFTAYTGI
jgi:hypothetical protein